MSLIRLEEVGKFYGTVEAVSELNLRCEDGEMLALLGPSGCGKSTTLKMIAGVEPVTRGEIFFGDRAVSSLQPGERNIAMVFEDYALYPHMSVFGNIAFPLKVRGLPSHEVNAKVKKIADLLGLEELSRTNVRSLSGGAQQRVSIGRALVRNPDLILFDEPLSHLDADQKIYLRTEIKRLQQSSGLTSILVTHDQTEAVAMADRVAVMNHGVLQQIGTPEDLYFNPSNLFVANFIGEPPMNLIDGRLCTENGKQFIVGNDWKLNVDQFFKYQSAIELKSQNLIVGIRPENIDVTRPHSGSNTDWMQGTVSFREPRGDSDVLTIVSDRKVMDPITMVAEVPGPSGYIEGSRVALNPKIERISFFDKDSTENIKSKKYNA
jgi:ABC-type sugar transport system ATPase subunit